MSEFAIFQTGGKQYRVAQGDIIKVEKLNADGKIEFDQVLMVGDKIGTPFVEGAKVDIDMVPQPCKERGIQSEDAPYSFSTAK